MSANLLELAQRLRFTRAQLKEIEGGLLKLDSMSYADAEAVSFHIPVIERALATCREMLGIADAAGPGDHELLLQGQRFGFAVSAAWDTKQARIVDPIGRVHDVYLDADGCPALTPELREALRRAIGIEAANG